MNPASSCSFHSIFREIIKEIKKKSEGNDIVRVHSSLAWVSCYLGVRSGLNKLFFLFFPVYGVGLKGSMDI